MYDLIKDNLTTILVLLFIIIFCGVYYYLDVPRIISKMKPQCFSFPKIKPILNKNAKVLNICNSNNSWQNLDKIYKPDIVFFLDHY